MFHRSQYRRFSYQQGCLRNCSVLVQLQDTFWGSKILILAGPSSSGGSRWRSLSFDNPWASARRAGQSGTGKAAKSSMHRPAQTSGIFVGFFFRDLISVSIVGKPHLWPISIDRSKTAQNHRGWKGLDSGIFFVVRWNPIGWTFCLQKPGMLSGDYGFSDLLKKGQECGSFFWAHTRICEDCKGLDPSCSSKGTVVSEGSEGSP